MELPVIKSFLIYQYFVKYTYYVRSQKLILDNLQNKLLYIEVVEEAMYTQELRKMEAYERINYIISGEILLTVHEFHRITQPNFHFLLALFFSVEIIVIPPLM